jgi:hypothetical protein
MGTQGEELVQISPREGRGQLRVNETRSLARRASVDSHFEIPDCSLLMLGERKGYNNGAVLAKERTVDPNPGSL